MIKPLINRRLLLGHPVIDLELAEIGRHWLRAVSCEALEFPLNLARLRKVMARHFEHEAELIAQTKRGLCTHHQADHKSLLDVCGEASALYDLNLRKSRSLIRHTLAKMMRQHIIYSDQCAVLIMHTYGGDELANLPPATA
jgi:hemerythrin